MTDGSSLRCGIDNVEIARVERLLLGATFEELLRIFSKEELYDAGKGSGRAASLAGRFAAKEACLKLFPREAALGLIGPEDFAVARDGYGAPRVVYSPKALELIARHRLKAIAVSLTHDKTRASAVAVAEPAQFFGGRVASEELIERVELSAATGLDRQVSAAYLGAAAIPGAVGVLATRHGFEVVGLSLVTLALMVFALHEATMPSVGGVLRRAA